MKGSTRHQDILSVVYLPVRTYNKLKAESAKDGIPLDELMNTYLVAGMSATKKNKKKDPRQK